MTDSIFGGGSGSGATPEPVPGPAAQATSATQPAPQPGAQPAAGKTYPNLGTVPLQAPTTSTAEQRQQITTGLVADNQNAAYSDQPVTAQQTGTPAPAPIPAPAPAPSADAGSTGGVPAVSQTTVNQPTQTATGTPAVQPSATVMPQPVTPPMPTAGATPLAPPPNPIPPAPAGGAMMASTQGAVTIDTSQLGGSPLPGYPVVPNSGTLPGYAAAPYSAPMGTVAATGQPIAIIFFADASAGISDRGQSVLHDVYLLQQQQGGHLRIVGHASLHTVTLDPARHDQVNLRLSTVRANAVARALIRMGVPRGTVAVAAEGSRAPVFYEFMPTGEAANRRVEIYLDR